MDRCCHVPLMDEDLLRKTIQSDDIRIANRRAQWAHRPLIWPLPRSSNAGRRASTFFVVRLRSSCNTQRRSVLRGRKPEDRVIAIASRQSYSVSHETWQACAVPAWLSCRNVDFFSPKGWLRATCPLHDCDVVRCSVINSIVTEFRIRVKSHGIGLAKASSDALRVEVFGLP